MWLCVICVCISFLFLAMHLCCFFFCFVFFFCIVTITGKSESVIERYYVPASLESAFESLEIDEYGTFREVLEIASFVIIGIIGIFALLTLYAHRFASQDIESIQYDARNNKLIYDHCWGCHFPGLSLFLSVCVCVCFMCLYCFC